MYDRDEFFRYRIAGCDAKSKFCDAKLNVIRRNLRCKAILTAQKNVVCMQFPCVHECMHLRTRRRLCSSVLSKIFACTQFLFTCRGALDSCYFPRMPYACRFLDFRVRRFDNKLQVAFDRVRCWLVEVLLTSQLGRWNRCREKRRLDFEKMFNMVCCADFCKLCRRSLHRFMDCRISLHVALLLMVLPAAPWRSWWSVVRIMRSACAAVYKNVWHRFTSLLQRKDYLFFVKIAWTGWAGKASRSSRIFFSKTPKRNCYTNHTNCYAIQFSCRRNCYAKCWQ